MTVPSDAGAGAGVGAGATGTIPANTGVVPEEYKPPEYTPETIVPPEYRDKEYLKTVKDFPSLFKALDGAQSLIGTTRQELACPVADAPQADWDAYYTRNGRPATADEYKEAEVVYPEGMAHSDEVSKQMKAICHKHGLSVKQFDGLSKDYTGLMIETFKTQAGAQVTSDAEFETLANQTFGDSKDKVLETAKKIINEHKPKGFETHLASLDNKSLILLAGVLDSVRTKYMSEDFNITPQGAGGGKSVDELRSDARVLMAKPEWSNSFHPGHETIKAQVKEIYDTVEKLQK